ncbi:FkbM family methyltransferase, partial [Vibrio crassostreae]|uniref:FkbM family methyltransferase n=1 Tax=Vibrio crassostreae TaxID=246167 RepID=UPI00352C37E8
MNFISYAQNFEDVMLWRALKHVENGFYIDIGANDPTEHSVTKSMYDRGWRGLNCEPVQYWFEKLEENRVDDLNLQIAIGATNEELEFFEVVNTGLSTLDRSIAEQHSMEYGFDLIRYTVPVESLTSICNRTNFGEVHFLKIDVEGAEKSVLQGIDFKIIRPWIVVVEATKPMSQDVDYEQWEYLITSKDYHFVYFDGLNRFYVANEHTELDCHFDRPPNVFDGFVRYSETEVIKAEAKVSEAEVKVSEAEAKVSEAEAKVSEAEAKVSE